MKIEVLYFAAIRELLGLSEERVQLDTELPASVQELSERLVALHPSLKGCLGSVRFAVNEEFVELSAAVRDGDTVALIPPVSGG